jgi:WD40 repeat protein
MEKPKFHTFLSHNNADKPAVETLARRLRQEGIEPWLDKWNLIPGNPWQEEIEKALDACASCCVFVGTSGIGPWQNEEMRTAINRRITDSTGFRVIPVLLPDSQRPERSKLPEFLTRVTWVEFRHSLDEADSFNRLKCGVLGIPPDDTDAGDTVIEGACPYRGLEIFDVKHAPFFFGREALTEWLLNELKPRFGQTENRFLAVLGASGSGKSSLARAGLVAALKRGALQGSAEWPVFILKPGKNPIESLALKFASDVTNVKLLQDQFGSDAHQLARTTRFMLRDQPEHYAVILIDQFEEVFTLCREPDLRRAFINNLLYASHEALSQAIVLLTIRADFYAKCAENDTLAAALSDHQLLIGSMSDTELRQAIVEPVKRVGWDFEPGLVEILIKDFQDQAGGLPLLEYALTQLWERCAGRRLTIACYDEIGKLEGALEQRANEIYGAFDAAEKDTCKQIFLRLTNPGEDEGAVYTRRRVHRNELGEAETTTQVLAKLTEARLITIEGAPNKADRFVEIAHESLIRGWPRLRAWLDEDRAFLLWRQHLAGALAQWKHTQYDAGALLRGASLEEAKRRLQERSGDLNQSERSYIKKCIAKQQRSRNLRWVAAILTFALAVAVVIVMGYQRNAAIEAETEAEKQREEALARKLAAQAELLRNQQAKSLELSVLLAVESVNRIPTIEADQALRHGLFLLPKQVTPPLNHQDSVLAIAVGSQGKLVASASWDGTERVWEAATGRPLASFDHKGFVRAIAFIPNEPYEPYPYLATAGADGAVRIWQVDTGQQIASARHDADVTAIAYSPNGPYLATASWDYSARIWELQAGALRERARLDHDDFVESVVFSRDGKSLATAGKDNIARLWDVATGKEILRIKHRDAVTDITISPKGNYLATASRDKTAELWEISGRRQLFSKEHKGDVRAVAFSPNSKYLATAGGESVQLWEISTRQTAGRPLRHENDVMAIAFSPAGKYLAAASRDGTARLWQVTSGREIGRMVHKKDVIDVSFYRHGNNINLITASHDGTARLWDLASLAKPGIAADGQPIAVDTRLMDALALSPDGRYLATASRNRVARLWQISSGKKVVEIRHNGFVRDISFSPSGEHLATASENESKKIWYVQIWEVPDGKEVLRWSQAEKIKLVAFDPMIQFLATAGDDDTVRIWKVATNQIVAQFKHASPIRAITFDPKGLRLATASGDSAVRLLEVSTGREIAVFDEQAVVVVAFSSQGEYLATASRSGMVKIWEVSSRRQIASRDMQAPVKAIVFGPDGRHKHIEIAAVSGNSVQVWEATTGRDLARMRSPHQVEFAASSPNGKYIAVVSEDSKARIWSLWPCDLVAEARTRLSRNLTQEERQIYLNDEKNGETCSAPP